MTVRLSGPVVREIREQQKKPLPVRMEGADRGAICVEVDDLVELHAWASLGHAAWLAAGRPPEETDYLISVWLKATEQWDREEWDEYCERQGYLTNQWIDGGKR